MGVAPSYADLRASQPQAGRLFNDEDNNIRARVAVIGVAVARQLFGPINPIGESIRLNKIPFQVIGVLPEKGSGGGRDQDDVVLVPVTTGMYRLLGKLYADSIDFEIQDISLTSAVQNRVLDLVAARHRVPPSQRDRAFSISNMADVQAALSENSRTMALLLASIATISLIVGGIGIMNIMLVSVSERTREIGLRKAVGARRRDIIMQFMSEAVVVSTVGGIGGILLGYIATLVLAFGAGWATSVSFASVALAFTFSALIGIAFGVYPARQAASLNPIEALRSE
jgi:macrolide transport system ATP-binding/permease protein